MGPVLRGPIGGKKQSTDTNEFSFLNRKINFRYGKVDWRCLEMDKLWRYNLHYFDYILDKDRPRESIEALIGDWIEKIARYYSADAWDRSPFLCDKLNWVQASPSPNTRENPEHSWFDESPPTGLGRLKNLKAAFWPITNFKNGKALFLQACFSAGADATVGPRRGRA
jgi:hypothetical protein